MDDEKKDLSRRAAEFTELLIDSLYDEILKVDSLNSIRKEVNDGRTEQDERTGKPAV
jgi:hypothetical protein